MKQEHEKEDTKETKRAPEKCRKCGEWDIYRGCTFESDCPVG